MTANLPLVGFYDYRIVALSVLIAVLAAYAALVIAGRLAAARDSTRLVWLCGASFAMGSGIWAMDYVGMAAFHLPVRVTYDWPAVLLSLFPAVLVSSIALYVVSAPIASRSRMIAGGIYMGSGIAIVHYIGMYAMRLPAMRVYSPWLVLLSFVLPMVFSGVAFRQAFRFQQPPKSGRWRKLGAALLMGLTIPATHYVGMAAVRFVPQPAVTDYDSVSVLSLSLVCALVVALMILGLGVLSSVVDSRFAVQEQRLAENLVRLQGIFDNMAEAVIIVDGGRSIVLYNQAATTLLGIDGHINTLLELAVTFEATLPTGEVLGMGDRPMMQSVHGTYCKNREMIVRRKDTGATATVEVSTAHLADSADGIPRVIITLRDITESKGMNETRTRLAAIVEFSEDAIIGKDDKGIVTTWNGGAEKIFGYTAAEMIGQSILRLVPEEHQGLEHEIMARVKRGETADVFEMVHKNKDGKFLEVSLTISPISDARGNIIGSSTIARNITQRKQFERQLQQSQKMEAIGQLTGGIAHDFNNLLSVIVGNLGLIGHLVFDNEAVKQRVQAAQRAATRGADLILRLLAFSRNVELSGEPTQLDDSINNVKELAHSLGPDLKIISHLDDAVPLVLVDAGGLENALLNLVVNARDAMPKGGTVTLSTQVSTLGEDFPAVLAGDVKAGRYAHIKVADNGHGMSKETLERVFEPFFTTKPRGKGTGLGMAMVYGFAKQSGGVVRIYSEPGNGTTVSIYLPLAEGDMPRAAAPGQKPSVGKLGGNVLVVDDEPDVLELAVIYLEGMGYTVYQAHDGASALQVLEQQRNIDLLVTDLIMPGGFNGAEIAQKARRWLPHIRVVYCSGFAAEVLEERDMPLVHGPLLNKPYRQEEFESIVSSAMTTEEDAVLTS